MPEVIGSVYGADTPQQDGRRYVTEVFVLSGGAVRASTYLAEVDADHDAHLADMVVNMNEALATLEPEAALALAEEANAEIVARLAEAAKPTKAA